MKFSITFDGADAASAAFRNLTAPNLDNRLAKVMGEAYYDAIKAWIAGGHSFTGRSGQLEQSIGWRPEADGAVVYATAAYAPAIEFGSGIHGPKAADYAAQGGYVIRPKAGRKALRLPLDGGDDFGPNRSALRRQVIHPGVKAQPYFFADMDERENLLTASALDYLATSFLDRTYFLDQPR